LAAFSGGVRWARIRDVWGEPSDPLKMAQCQLRLSEARRAEFGADAPASDR